MQIADSKLRVAILMGGIGEEREISLQSGRCVTQALQEAGLKAIAADIQPNSLDILDNDDIGVFFVALHGQFGEDGHLQQILEDKSLCYTGSGPAASRLAFDKLASKNRFAQAGLTTPKAIAFEPRVTVRQIEEQVAPLSGRFVVKPVRQGSTIGVTMADDPRSALADARECSSKFGDCMIEEFIAGREITVGILENRALPIIEIKPKTGFYDYRAKYVDEGTEFLFDTIDPALAATIKTGALDGFNALGLKHFARLDFILGNDQKAYVLEANTIPGLTTHSLLPKAAAKMGLSMSDLCLKIVDAARSSLVSRRT